MKSAKEILQSHEKFRINLGLKRVKLVLALLDNPQKYLKFIHIAGTNGKGSTSKIINQILIEHFKNKGENSKKVGLFTSPHLFSYQERIKIDNVDIPEYILNRLTSDIDNFAKKNNIELSEFELIFVVSIYYFYIKKVDYVVLEVGLGGKYDATNVVMPIIEAITTIDFDHTERLGDTISKIALQKAGIIKKDSKVVVSKSNLGFDVIKKVSENENAALILADDDIKIEFKNNKNYATIKDKKYEFNLLGSHQKENLALALGVVQNIDISIDEVDIKQALKNVSWKFRLDFDNKKNILIDGAHNPSGANVLRKFLDENFKNIKKKFYFGCLKNKDYKKMVQILLKEAEGDELYFSEFSHNSSLKFEEFIEDLKNNNISIQNIKKAPSKEEFLKENKTGLKIFCGSLYMLGEIFKDNSK